MRTGWCTTARFAQEAPSFHFCGSTGHNRQQHYIACGFTRKWLDRLSFAVQDAEDTTTERVVRRIGGGGAVAVRIVAALAATLSACDARRQGSSSKPMDLWAAGLKEVVRRHIASHYAARQFREV